jgi:hypothetical protein
MHVQVIRVGRKRRMSPDKIERRGKGDTFQTVVDIERRLLRACQTLRALPDPDKKFQWVGSAWPEMVRSTEEAYGYAEAIMPRFRPTPVDVSDYLVALSWARMIPWDDFRLVWWRSFDLSFGQIAMRIHKTDETARRRYRDVLLRIWHAFNYPSPTARRA